MEVFEWLRFMIGTAVLLCGLAIFVIEIYGIFHLRSEERRVGKECL